MQRQRFHFIQRAALQIERIQIVVTAQPAIAARLLIVRAGRPRGDVVGDHPQSIRGAGKRAEQPRQFAIHPFQDQRDMAEKLFRGLGVKLRVGSQVGEKRRKVAAELDLPHDRFHLRADAFHFGQPRGMDLFRRQVGGRKQPYAMPVELAALGKRRRADGTASRRDIFAFHEFQEAAIAGNHRLGDRVADQRGQTRTIGFGNRGGPCGHRRVQEALRGILDDVRGDRIAVAFQHHGGQHESPPHSLPHQLKMIGYILVERP